MDLEKMIEAIVKEIMNRLENKPNRLLVLYTGSMTGYKESINQILQLKDLGWDVEVLFNRCSEAILSKEKIANDLVGINIVFESRYPMNRDLLEGVKAILIPVMTMNFTAKVALGIADTPALSLVADGLLNGMPIYVVQDASRPEDRIRGDWTSSPKPETYYKMFLGYFKKLQEFGMKMVCIDKLCETVNGLNIPSTLPASGNVSSKSDKKSTRKIITQEDIILAKGNNGRIETDSRTIMTALARETARELGVDIICI